MQYRGLGQARQKAMGFSTALVMASCLLGCGSSISERSDRPESGRVPEAVIDLRHGQGGVRLVLSSKGGAAVCWPRVSRPGTRQEAGDLVVLYLPCDGEKVVRLARALHGMHNAAPLLGQTGGKQEDRIGWRLEGVTGEHRGQLWRSWPCENLVVDGLVAEAYAIGQYELAMAIKTARQAARVDAQGDDNRAALLYRGALRQLLAWADSTHERRRPVGFHDYERVLSEPVSPELNPTRAWALRWLRWEVYSLVLRSPDWVSVSGIGRDGATTSGSGTVEIVCGLRDLLNREQVRDVGGDALSHLRGSLGVSAGSGETRQ